MPLKAVLDSLDGLNEGQSELYVEQDGKFFLDLDADSLKDHPGTKPLVVAYQREKSDGATAKQEVTALKAQIAELQKGAPDTAATQAKLTQLQDQLAAKEAEVGDWKGRYMGKARDEVLSRSLQSSGIVDPAFLEAAQAVIERKYKIEVDQEGTATIDNGMGPKLVPDFIKAWVASEGSKFVAPPSGGGASGGKGGGAAAPNRSGMNAAQKADYIAEHGQAAFLKLPR